MMWWGSIYGSGLGSWGWLLMALVPICMIIVVVGAAILLWGGFMGSRSHYDRRGTGLDTLHERYARGDIGRDEYLEKKRDLTG